MTIEERAEKFASVFPRSEQHFAEECYIQGATEQKKIDHEEWQKDMRYVNVRKQELIDKACKTFCRFCPHQCEDYPHDDCQVQIEYRKAMEE